MQIPKDFYKTCIVDENPLSVTKVPGSYSSFYVDQQINAWLNSIRTYTAAGFSQKEAATAALEQSVSEVTMYHDEETAVETPGYTYYFRYIPFLFLAVLCYSMGYILLAFRKEDIQKRMLASAISTRRQNLEGLLAMFTISLLLWLIAVVGARCYVWKRTPDFQSSGVLSVKYIPDADNCTFTCISDRPFYEKHQHAQRIFQHHFPWYMFPVRCLCANEYHG